LLELGNSSPYIVVFAGETLSPDDESFILEYDLASRVQVIVRPSHALLNKLYILSHALLFPSFAEGFGWPLIEAQACGSPVIASCTTSIPEVAGNAALFADPLDVTTFALYVRSLEDPDLRSRLIHNGFSNIRRFDPQLIKASFTAFALDPMQSTL
jgi:glycosyltransferase involved in cell wall biosynthesis